MEMARRWTVEPTYSHGYLVPLFAVYFLWARRERLDPAQLHPNWWGLLIVLLGTAMRLVFGYFSITSPDRFSIIPVLVGVCVALGGWHALAWAWPSIAFLLFMIPLPAGSDQFLTRPLQRMAAIASTYLLQSLGFVAESEGNVILLPDGELEVAEACSGLRMFMTFCALCTAIAALSHRSTIQRVIILASAFPLALICNVLRITLAGIAYAKLGADAAHAFYHSLAGWIMIVAAVGFLSLELLILSHLFIPAEVAEIKPRPRTTPVRNPRSAIKSTS
jgi:exosortase